MTLIIDLPPEKEAGLKAQARAAGVSAEEFTIRALDQVLPVTPSPEAEEAAAEDYRPISRVIAEIMSDVPEEELAKLPRDGASQLDHYLYGAPKR